MGDELPPRPAGNPSREAELRSDCERCCGLCCVAPAFSASPDFAIEKGAGEPCPNLDAGCRCVIHDRLAVEGFSGCSAYECFGAGQKVTQVTYAGRRDWIRTPEVAAEMFDVFMVMRQLHELLMYLDEATKLPPAAPLQGDLEAALASLDAITRQGPQAILEVDVPAQRRIVERLLRRTSELVRAHGWPRRG